jgi:hypothetical protein
MNTPDELYTRWFQQQDTLAVDKSFDPLCLNIVLTGTIYMECTCKILIIALKLMPPVLRSRVRIHYFGASAKLIEGDFNDAGLREYFLDYGYVSKSVAIAAVKSADVLLSLVYDKENSRDSSAVLGLMTTKVFDYLLSGKPIINIGPLLSDVCILARESDYSEFHNFDLNQTNELSQFMATALCDLDKFRQRVSFAKLPDFSINFTQIIKDVLVTK